MSTPAHETGCTVADLLADPDLGITLLADGPAVRSRRITGSVVHLGHQALPGEGWAAHDPRLLVHLSDHSDPEGFLSEVERVVTDAPDPLLALWPPPGVTAADLLARTGDRAVLRLPAHVGPSRLIEAVASWTSPTADALTRRLTALQRSLTQSLARPAPIPDLTKHLARMCNAVAGLMSASGAIEAATGPLPLAMLKDDLATTTAEAQTFSGSGWSGIAVRVGRTTPEGTAVMWLVLASRRPMFPDAYAIAAAHVAASLAETHLQFNLLLKRQDRAVRSSVLEHLLAFRVLHDEPELTGRLAALGVSFQAEVRCVVVALSGSVTQGHVPRLLSEALDRLDWALTADDVPHLLGVHDRHLVALVQATATTTTRLVARSDLGPPRFVLGIGRAVGSVGRVVDSFNDALLAVRLSRRSEGAVWTSAYEDFDFATRLFADVGLERMGEWAEEQLAPLADQQILVEGLEQYFKHHLNIIAAAQALNVHHNSLRYRLAKVEALLSVSLRDPAVISSLHLALMARSMLRVAGGGSRDVTALAVSRAAPGTATELTGRELGQDVTVGLWADAVEHVGAARGPER